MKTIKELRKADAYRLAERISQDPTAEEIQTAEKAMRAYYRFASSYLASFYTEQDRSATQTAKDEADAKSERAYKKASDLLKPYAVRISCPGLYPIIEDMNGVNFTYGHFYS